jgi:hypothetical protein
MKPRRSTILTTNDPDFDRTVRATPPGMFFWAGSCVDPAAICGGCLHFQPEHPDALRGCCGKVHDHKKTRGVAFDRRTAACKYFENAPPDLAQRADVKRGAGNYRRDEMDLAKYAGNSFIKAADVADGPIRDVINDIVEGEYEKPNLILASGRRFSVNTTNTGRLIKMFGRDSKNAIGQAIELYPDEIEINGRMQATVLIRPVPKPRQAAPAPRRGGDPISSGRQPEPPPHDSVPDGDFDDDIPL